MEPRVFSRMGKLACAAPGVLNVASRYRMYVYRFFLMAPLAPWLHVELSVIQKIYLEII